MNDRIRLVSSLLTEIRRPMKSDTAKNLLQASMGMLRGWRFWASLLFFLLILAGLTYRADRKVKETTAPFLMDEISALPATKVAIVLGTSPTLRDGTPNDFYTYRMDAAEALYRSGKVRHLVLSGDNRHASYNEPEAMRKSLLARGIPDSIMHPDYAGFRTFDSMIRLRDVFGQDSCIIVSQRFHNERAAYIARQQLGMAAFGLNAREVTAYKGFKTMLRELFARDKMFLDQWFGTEPHFLGEPIEIR